MKRLALFVLLGVSSHFAYAACPAFESLKTALNQQDWQQSAALLPSIETSCNSHENTSAKNFYADVLAKAANNLLNEQKIEPAEALLNKAPTVTWAVLSVRGDIAAERKQWLEASQFYGQAYDLLGDIKAKNSDEQQRLNQQRQQLADLAEDAQLLYGKIDSTKNRDGLPQGIRLVDRGFAPAQAVLPVHFDTNASTLNNDGLASASVMANFLKDKTNTSSVKVIGFADPRGTEAHNQTLSEQRAQTVADYLKRQGVNVTIETLGKGETEPPKTNFHKLTEAEKLKRWRRVELEVK